MADISVIGLGRMGLPVSAVLVEAGYQVAATDLGTAARADAAACGASWRDSAVQVLEAPAGGGPEAARQGRLQLFIGGDAEVLAGNRAILEVLAAPEQIIHVGGFGAGYTAKLLVNLLWFRQAIATAEALLIGQAAGIDVRVLQSTLTGSPAASAFITHYLDPLLDGDYLTSFDLPSVCDELEAIVALAREHQVPSALSDLVLQTHRRALRRYGAADGELLAVALLEEEAARHLRAETD